jgi:octaheme c-type cytochrome (tetrathionate reductase family)
MGDFGAIGLSLVVAGSLGVWTGCSRRAPAPIAAGYERHVRGHFDHTPVTPDHFASAQDVTRACLSCHPEARSVMKTSHWQWLGDDVQLPGRKGHARIGKKNLINNFCISTVGNEKSCTKCHAGYGWTGPGFDFADSDNVDCLVCHESSGRYVKGEGGMPTPQSDLVAAARSVGTPSRENCLGCHAYGGGGQAVKHGDIDSSLIHPPVDEDVHMGRHGMICVDCHGSPDHQLRGRAFSVSVEDAHGVACTDCHRPGEHKDARLDVHLSALACQACHIPSFARTIPTKATWDWSKAGDKTREDDAHHYLKIKGEFTYEQDVVPEYRWFDMTVTRYLAGDVIDPSRVTPLNSPRGGIRDKAARIWPFKVHRARQPYDVVNRYLLAPVTGGEGGYWTSFDWDRSMQLAVKPTGLAYSGQLGFAETEMVWPLSHMVVGRDKALGCTDCHGDKGRLDWKALGYEGDPVRVGGRK